MDTLVQDLRYAVRGLRRAPGFTLVAILTLALGIGVNSAIFSLVNAVLYRPLPVERPEELVNLYGHSATTPGHESLSYPNIVDIAKQTTTLAGLVGYTNFFGTATVDRNAALVIGELVTERYFEVLGVRPVLGRTFTTEENSGGKGLPVAVLSHRLWQQRFDGDRGVIGRQFRMNGQVFTVVGVAPATFGGMMPAVTAQMWLPSAMAEVVEPMGSNRVSGLSPGATRAERRGQHWLWARGRMKPGVVPAQVRAEMETISARLAVAHPEVNARERVVVVPSSEVRINPEADAAVRPVGLVLVAAVTLVLVVACGNLANLLLSRAAGRRRELSMRVALGASRGRVLRQLLTESMVVAVGGGLAAIPLAAGLTMLAVRVRPPLPVDLGLSLAPDWRVLAFTTLTAVATGVLIGLLPALRASRPNLVATMRDGGAWMGGRRGLELRDALVIAQVAVSLVLVVAGTLLVRSVQAAANLPLGYDPDRLAHIDLSPAMSGYDREGAAALVRAARDRVTALPWVEQVALTSRLPLSLNNNGFAVVIDGHQGSASDRPYNIDGAYVDEHYVSTLGLRVIAGRALEAADVAERQRVVVVTRAMAERYWPGAGAVGREIRLRWGAEPHRIVGVVDDYKVNTPGEPAMPYLHVPRPPGDDFANFIVRVRGEAGPRVSALIREFHALDPDLAFMDTGTLRGLSNVRLFPVRAGAVVIGAFGGLALMVAAIGLYGVIGYSVSRRVREIGIRKALGAERSTVIGMVMGQGMRLVAVGGMVGLGLAAMASRALSAVLFVGPFDLTSFVTAFGVLATVAGVANAVPAWRASRVDAMVALRQE